MVLCLGGVLCLGALVKVPRRRSHCGDQEGGEPMAMLAGGMPGLSIPMGMFVPNLLIGALIGRSFGEIMTSYLPDPAGRPVHEGIVWQASPECTLGQIAVFASAVVAKCLWCRL